MSVLHSFCGGGRAEMIRTLQTAFESLYLPYTSPSKTHLRLANHEGGCQWLGL